MSEESRFHSHYGFYFLLTEVVLAALVMIPLTIIIIYHYYKHKAQLTSKTAMFKIALFYFFVTLLFCINYCCRLLNECFGRLKYEYIFVCTTVFFYGLHFILLIYLLYSRLYYVLQKQNTYWDRLFRQIQIGYGTGTVFSVSYLEKRLQKK